MRETAKRTILALSTGAAVALSSLIPCAFAVANDDAAKGSWSRGRKDSIHRKKMVLTGMLLLSKSTLDSLKDQKTLDDDSLKPSSTGLSRSTASLLKVGRRGGRTIGFRLRGISDDRQSSDGGKLSGASSKRRRRTDVKFEKRKDRRFTPKKIRKMLGPKLQAVRMCYEDSLRRNYRLKGKLTVLVTIDSEGRVRNVRQKKNELNKKTFACIRRRALKWRFPRPEGGRLTIALPLNLAPKTAY